MLTSDHFFKHPVFVTEPTSNTNLFLRIVFHALESRRSRVAPPPGTFGPNYFTTAVGAAIRRDFHYPVCKPQLCCYESPRAHRAPGTTSGVGIHGSVTLGGLGHNTKLPSPACLTRNPPPRVQQGSCTQRTHSPCPYAQVPARLPQGSVASSLQPSLPLVPSTTLAHPGEEDTFTKAELRNLAKAYQHIRSLEISKSDKDKICFIRFLWVPCNDFLTLHCNPSPPHTLTPTHTLGFWRFRETGGMRKGKHKQGLSSVCPLASAQTWFPSQ